MCTIEGSTSTAAATGTAPHNDYRLFCAKTISQALWRGTGTSQPALYMDIYFTRWFVRVDAISPVCFSRADSQCNVARAARIIRYSGREYKDLLGFNRSTNDPYTSVQRSTGVCGTVLTLDAWKACWFGDI